MLEKRVESTPQIWSVDVRDPTNVTAARHRFVAALRRAFPDSDVSDAEVTFSELLGNVHAHTPGPAIITLERASRRLVLSVADRGPLFEPPSEAPNPLEPKGRGLQLVTQLAGPIRVEPINDDWKAVRIDLPIVEG